MLVMLEGFDKYGAANTNIPGVLALLNAGEWTSGVTGSPNYNISPPLTSVGQAFSNSGNGVLAKTLSANYSRLIGGYRFRPDGYTQQTTLMGFRDGATFQCTLVLDTNGVIALRTGSAIGVILSSGGVIALNSVHFIEWDITFGASSSYQIWLDGVSLFSGTGNTRGGTTNNYANAFSIGGNANGSITIDDLYLFDSTGSTNNAVLLTQPRIDTSFAIADSAVQFAVGAATLGSSVGRVPNTVSYGPAINQLYLRPFTPTRNCTLNSIAFQVLTTVASLQARPVVYADSAGSPGALLSAGSTVVGITAGTTLTMPLTTPQSLTAGTQYWLGMMNDIVAGSSFAVLDASAAGRSVTSTFASGAPSTAPAMTPGFPSALVFGNITGTGVNYYEVAQTPPGGTTSYVFDSTIGHEDLYSFSAITNPATADPPTTIYAASVKANVGNSTSGSRSVSVRMKSGATDSAGSLGTVPIFQSFSWYGSSFPVDPATGAAWTISGFNAATSGLRLDA